jgi:hypothetical protein
MSIETTEDRMNVIEKLPMEKYLALPAVSASILKRMVDECPRAAWFDSWLNDKRVIETSDAMDAGTIAHSILLEGNAGKVCVIDPNDHPAEKTGNIPDGFTNKSIRTARDVARAAGQIPVLLKDMNAIEAMVDSAAAFIDSLKHSEPAIYAQFQEGGGQSEVTITWDDNGTPCRIRPDRISTDRKLIVDLKTTATSANPDRWGRTQMVGMGYYMSAAFYRRGCQAAFGTEPDYVFLVVESESPYLCSLVGVDPSGFELGREKIEHGLGLWAQCVARNQWPAYPSRVCYPVMPAWEVSRWEEEKSGHEYNLETMWGAKK